MTVSVGVRHFADYSVDDNLLHSLREIYQLHKTGILSDEEYQQQQKLLDEHNEMNKRDE